MVKSMADYVQNKVIEVAHRIENSFDHLADWWQENRERLMGINSSKHDLKDSKEMLENLKEVEENRRKQLENELRQALRHQEREKVIVEDMRLYGLNRGNAELMCDQKPAVKEFVMAITDDIQSIQRLYQLPPIDRQKLIAAVYDEPQRWFPISHAIITEVCTVMFRTLWSSWKFCITAMELSWRYRACRSR